MKKDYVITLKVNDTEVSGGIIKGTKLDIEGFEDSSIQYVHIYLNDNMIYTGVSVDIIEVVERSDDTTEIKLTK